ncbi:hypothetical protein [Undibacterium rugosum]|uniref:HD domain-containing protein n=1 Tax=Undibacterium rugosum TaxID=2762291 RepID=UPI001B835EC2|nr:hypothetical protein [Undibacterium rugosum]MBR7778159.1 hypothetical protein [Undibacterium rugosum]
MQSLSPDQMLELSACWDGLMLQLQADPVQAQSCRDWLYQHYAQPERHYHQFSHILALLRYARQYRDHLVNPLVVDAAIWFHDVIYDTRAKDNEAQSALQAAYWLKQFGTDAAIIDAVVACIVATAGHRVPENELAIPDLPLFLDFDLAILGQSVEVYQAYTQAIQAEYQWVPGMLYRAGRKKLLTQFLERPRLYFTDTFFELYEHSARRNIAHEIAQLTLFSWP